MQRTQSRLGSWLMHVLANPISRSLGQIHHVACSLSLDTYKHYYVSHRLSVLKTQVSFGNCAEHSIFMVFIPLGVRGQVGGPKSLYFCPRSGLKMSTWRQVVVKKGQNCVQVVIDLNASLWLQYIGRISLPTCDEGVTKTTPVGRVGSQCYH